MAKRRPDRFRVGQRCYFVFGASMGWHRVNGEECVIIEPRQRVDVECADFDGRNVRMAYGVERYKVRWRDGEVWTAESTLRPIDDTPELSTWEKFVKKTGIDPRKKPAVAKRRKRTAA